MSDHDIDNETDTDDKDNKDDIDNKDDKDRAQIIILKDGISCLIKLI